MAWGFLWVITISLFFLPFQLFPSLMEPVLKTSRLVRCFVQCLWLRMVTCKEQRLIVVRWGGLLTAAVTHSACSNSDDGSTADPCPRETIRWFSTVWVSSATTIFQHMSTYCGVVILCPTKYCAQAQKIIFRTKHCMSSNALLNSFSARNNFNEMLSRENQASKQKIKQKNCKATLNMLMICFQASHRPAAIFFFCFLFCHQFFDTYVPASAWNLGDVLFFSAGALIGHKKLTILLYLIIILLGL